MNEIDVFILFAVFALCNVISYVVGHRKGYTGALKAGGRQP